VHYTVTLSIRSFDPNEDRDDDQWLAPRRDFREETYTRVITIEDSDNLADARKRALTLLSFKEEK
jgi:hypothetical protein